MNKTKRTLIMSSIVMVMTFVVAIVGISAAWFGDVRRVSTNERDLIISSQRSDAQATIEIDSASTSVIGGDRLVPAIADKGWLLDQANSDKDVNALDVLNGGEGISAPATQVVLYLPFMYVGVPDEGFTDGRKFIRISLSSATLENPRKKGEDGKDIVDINGMINFLDEFKAQMTVVKKVADATSEQGTRYEEYTPEEIEQLKTDKNGISWQTGEYGNSLDMLIAPGVSFYCKVTLYFAKVDEECDHDLLDTTVFFNFGISAIDREQTGA